MVKSLLSLGFIRLENVSHHQPYPLISTHVPGSCGAVGRVGLGWGRGQTLDFEVFGAGGDVEVFSLNRLYMPSSSSSHVFQILYLARDSEGYLGDRHLDYYWGAGFFLVGGTRLTWPKFMEGPGLCTRVELGGVTLVYIEQALKFFF